MQVRDQWQDYFRAGKQAVQKGAAAARQIAIKVSAEAVRQANIAQPVIADFCRKARPVIEHQVQLTKPALKYSAKQAAFSIHTSSRRLYALCRPTLQWIPIRIALGLAIGLCGITALALAVIPQSVSKSLMVQSAPAESPLDMELALSAEKPAVWEVTPDEIHPAPLSLQSMFLQVTAPVMDPAQEQRRQREQDLAELRQQAQLELQQAEENYNFAVQQWNAEVAACQQGGVPPGYTSQQMGRFAAMGVRLQPRQPNQALLYAAQQAEQRYLQARDNYQRLVNAP